MAFFRKKIAEKFGGLKKKQYFCTRFRKERAFSSAGLEHLPYKQRVGGSNPSTPTTRKGKDIARCPFLLQGALVFVYKSEERFAAKISLSRSSFGLCITPPSRVADYEEILNAHF